MKKIKGNVFYDPCLVGGYLDFSDSDTKATFPQLTTVRGSLDFRGVDMKDAFPKLTPIMDAFSCSNSDTKATFPKLTTVSEMFNDDCNGPETTDVSEDLS